MAAVTVQSEAVKSGLRPDDRLPGVVICRTGKYTNAGAKDANSVIELVPVPKGAQIVGIDTYIGQTGAGRTVDIGDGDLVDRYFDGLDASSAAIRKGLVADGDPAYIENYEYAANDTIDAKWLGATLEDGQTIHMNVFYKMGDTMADE